MYGFLIKLSSFSKWSQDFIRMHLFVEANWDSLHGIVVVEEIDWANINLLCSFEGTIDDDHSQQTG